MTRKERQTVKPWRLPEIELREDEELILRAHFSTPTDSKAGENAPVSRERFVPDSKISSALADLRCSTAAWKNTNERLLAKARRGDEDAFFELIARDPRYLCSEIGLVYIVRWQSNLDVCQTFSADADAQRECLKDRLRGISRALLRPFDRRGSSHLPSAGAVSLLYLSARAYFLGLQRLVPSSSKHRAREVSRIRTVLAKIKAQDVLEDAKDRGLEHTFLLPVLSVEAVIGSMKTTSAGHFDSVAIVAEAPFRLAKRLVEVEFGIGSRTIDKLLKSSTVTTWALPRGRVAGFSGKPPAHILRIWEHPVVRRSLRKK